MTAERQYARPSGGALVLERELLRQIGNSLEPRAMLQSFMWSAIRHSSARSALFGWLSDEGLRWYPCPAEQAGIWDETAWRARLEAFVRSPAETELHFVADGRSVQALRAGDKAALFVETDSAVIDAECLAALRAVMPRLALACEACLAHEQARVMLALVQRQNLDLELARERAEALARSRSEFVAVVSHEMRTPLNSILGFTELLQLELTSTEHRDYVRSIHVAAGQLRAMFGDLMDLAKLNSLHLVLRPENVPVIDLCAEVWAPHSAQAQLKGLACAMTLAPELPTQMVVDPVRLRQVLNNLLGNAVRYTLDGRIDFEVRLLDGLLAFCVADTGPGIAIEAQPQVFERFRQVGETVQHREGSGLGLAIARELADQMGGFIDLHSQPGRGTAFTLFLPRIAPGSAGS